MRIQLRHIGLAGLLLVAASAVPAHGAVLEIAYSSLERMIVQRLMTQGGRYYLQGDPSNTCAYSFVQEPKVDAVGTRLRITALYAGRAGKEILGKCVGAGDNFNLQITGVPSFSNGEFFLEGLDIQAPDTPYFRLVAPLIRSRLERDLRYPLKSRLDDASAWISSLTSSGQVAVESIGVDSIKVGERSVTLQFDFGMSVKPR